MHQFNECYVKVLGSDPSEGRMAARLKLKKRKKYHPPCDDFKQQVKTDEDKHNQQDII